ncbi:hypothetical protein NDU88_005681 [Pleurodeles waltl]|uniref:Uncharacterized protein n=1 Tax=Pleurodeles waltl TaxID=8319 RepID=A0AAV7N6K3_PLEWA|nr:hypothetical protein NDU88_005681 [Pleurodeles waltl]
MINQRLTGLAQQRPPPSDSHGGLPTRGRHALHCLPNLLENVFTTKQHILLLSRSQEQSHWPDRYINKQRRLPNECVLLRTRHRYPVHLLSKVLVVGVSDTLFLLALGQKLRQPLHLRPAGFKLLFKADLEDEGRSRP